MEQFIIDKIVDHRINRSRRHRYARAGEPLYRARWYGFHSEDETWEPTKHLPRIKILAYYLNNKLSILGSIELADEV